MDGREAGRGAGKSKKCCVARLHGQLEARQLAAPPAAI